MLRHLLPGLAVLPLILAALRPIADSDVPMHAAVGRYLLQHHRFLPTPDPLVWTDKGGDHPHEWLAQGLIGWVADTGGLGALRPLLALVAALCGWLLLRIGRRLALDGAQQAMLVIAWTVAVSPHLAMRPHVLGWACALAVIGLGVGDPRPWTRRMALMWLGMVALWANLHASVLIAPVYAVLAGLDVVWQHRRNLRGLPWRQPALRLGVCAAGALCQPMGPQLLTYVAQSQAINGALSDEWQPLLQADVLQGHPLVVAVLALAALGAVLTVARGGWPGPVSAATAVVHAAGTRRMTVFLFVPLLAGLAALGSRAGGTVRWAARLATLVALLAAGVDAASWIDRPALARSAYPQRAAAFLRHTALQGHLFNPDPWGGYLSWVLYPQQKVYLDGRWLLAGSQTVTDGIALQARQHDVGPLVHHYDLEIFVQRSADYAQVPPLDPAQWRMAWQDSLAVVLVRTGRHWPGNLARICSFYQQFPNLIDHARWNQPRRLQVGAVLDHCHRPSNPAP